LDLLGAFAAMVAWPMATKVAERLRRKNRSNPNSPTRRIVARD
jgi:hypothetical protein